MTQNILYFYKVLFFTITEKIRLIFSSEMQLNNDICDSLQFSNSTYPSRRERCVKSLKRSQDFDKNVLVLRPIYTTETLNTDLFLGI